ncbi:MAG TPA: LysR family transcriptional regulator [Xanthomonadales bacterium]|nr:LysR family transcriptional regulator [Xanthomonadales bacterium]
MHSNPSFNINLKSLECFRTIINTGSATSAAQQLGITQPAVSRLLGQLEARIGFPLFYRSKGRLVPTDEALAYYKEVDIALQSMERVHQLADNLGNVNFGELSIVAPPSMAETILPGLIADFLREHPRVHVSLDSQSVETARDMVALRAVDCGFVRMPAEFPGLSCRALIRTGSVCVIPSAHPLAARKRIQMHQLGGEPLILLGKGRQSRRDVDEAFRVANIKPQVRVETHTVGSACALARGGVGIAIVNEMLGLQYQSEGIVFRPLLPRIQNEYGFMSSSEAPMTRVTRRFLEHCLQHFKENKSSFRL